MNVVQSNRLISVHLSNLFDATRVTEIFHRSGHHIDLKISDLNISKIRHKYIVPQHILTSILNI